MRPAERLSVLLQAEREQILKGDLSGLLEIDPQKAALAAELESSHPTEAELQSVRSHAQALASVIEACKRGVEMAQGRLAAQEEVRAGLTTYGPEGKNRTISSKSPQHGGRF